MRIFLKTLVAASLIAACAPPEVSRVPYALSATETIEIRKTEYVTSGPAMQSTTYDVWYEGRFYPCPRPTEASCAATYRALQRGTYQQRIQRLQSTFADGQPSSGLNGYTPPAPTGGATGGTTGGT